MNPNNTYQKKRIKMKLEVKSKLTTKSKRIQENLQKHKDLTTWKYSCYNYKYDISR